MTVSDPPQKPDAQFVEQLLQRAVSHHHAGQLQQAEDLYRVILQTQPAHPDANHNMGILAVQRGRPAAGLPYFRTALTATPAQSNYWLSYIEALIQTGDEDTARQVLTLGQQYGLQGPAAAALTARLMARAQDKTDAAQPGEDDAPQQPVSAPPIPSNGEKSKKSVSSKSKKASGKKAVKEMAGTAPRKEELDAVIALNAEGRFAEMATLARSLTTRFPKRTFGWKSLGLALFSLSRPEEALISAQKAVELAPDDVEAHNIIGNVFLRLRNLSAAEASYRKALKINPDFADAYHGLATVLLDLGQLNDAMASCRRALQLKPDFVATWALLANLQKMTLADDDWLQNALSLLPKGGRAALSDGAIALGFSIGKYYDDTKQYELAFPAFTRANTLRRQTDGGINRAGISQRSEALIATYTADFIRQRREGSSQSQRPVLIAGMPRSGTSLTEQIIASHPDAFGAGELSFWIKQSKEYPLAELSGKFDPALLGRIAGEYEQLLQAYSVSASRVVDKLPGNFWRLGLITTVFPQARIIHTQRNPVDTCLSIYFQNFNATHLYATDLDDLAFYYREYVRIMDHWRSVLPAERFLEVPYEALTEDQEQWSRRIIEFIGLDWDERCLDFHKTERKVGTASNWQVRQKIYRTSLERWRNYEKHLGPLRALLEIETRMAGPVKIEQSCTAQQTIDEAPPPAAPMPATLFQGKKPETSVAAKSKESSGKAASGAKEGAAPSPQELDAVMTLLSQGRLAETETLLRSLTTRFPLHGSGWKGLGHVLELRGRLEEAAAAMQKAAELAPGDVEVHNILGNILLGLRNLSEAEASFRRAVLINPGYAEAHSNLGNVLCNLGQHDEAAASCRRALQINPGLAEAHYNLGFVLFDLGQLDGAMACCRRALEIRPAYMAAWAMLANLRKMTLADEDWLHKALRMFPQEQAALSDEAIGLGFSIGKYYDDTKQYDLAFPFYKRANSMKRQKEGGLDRAGLSRRVDTLISTYTADFIRQQREGASPSRRPVLIAGMPRSGTTLTEQIIASHPDAFGAGELAFWATQSKAYPTAELFGKYEPALLDKIAGEYEQLLLQHSATASRVVDKMPGNFWRLGLIATVFPQARIVHTQRNPIDTCLSIYFQNFNVVQLYATDLDDLAFYCREYVRIMNHWRSVLPAERFLDVPYEALTEDQEGWSRRIIEFIGLEWDKRCLDFHKTERKIATASNWQVRQKIYQTSKARWRNYEKHVGPLLALLANEAPIRTGPENGARQTLAPAEAHGLPDSAAGQSLGKVNNQQASTMKAFGNAAMLPAAPIPATPLHDNKLKMSKVEKSKKKAGKVASNTMGRPAPSPQEINMLMALYGQGRFSEMEALARSFTTRFPAHESGWKALGHLFHLRGQLENALVSMQKAVELSPADVQAHNILGNIFVGLKNLPAAEASYRQALKIEPGYADAHSNLGVVLRGLGKLDESVASCRRALELKPDFAEAHHNLGAALRDLQQFDEAAECCRRSLQINPDFAPAHHGLGYVLFGLGKLDEAAASFRRAVEIKPEYDEAHSNLLFCLSHNGEIDSAALFAEHLRFAEKFEAPLRSSWPQHSNSRDPERRLQVGIVSGDLRKHAVGNFIEPLLASLAARGSLSLHAYYNHATEDSVTHRVRKHFSHWNAVVGLNDIAFAEKIRTDGIDILIDLSGHTAKHRLLCFARKPAPVQASWIGYPGTTGLSAMDYYLADRFLLPAGQFDGRFTEKIVRLPANAPFLPYEGAPAVDPLPALSNGYVTFGSFNRLSKLSRPVIALWSQLLRALPDSRMILGAMPQDRKYDTLIDWFAQEGIARERLSFHARCDMQAYMGLHQQVDICLDTFPYNGGTTTQHALWMGVPTLTLAGAGMQGRVGLAVLSRIGLQDFVVERAEDFAVRGLYWAGNLSALAELRAGLREHLTQSPLRKPEVIAAGLERALRIMWQRWCAGLPTESFEVSLQNIDGITQEFSK